MHRALQTPEITLLIADQVSEFVRSKKYDDVPTAAVKADLLHFALACQIFRDPALNLLWCVLETVRPLLRCLPADLWEDNDGVFTLRNHRNLQEEDFALFREYGRKVRAIRGDWEDGMFPNVDRDSLRTINDRPWSRTLLPNLKCLSTEITHEMQLPEIKMLMVPSLMEIHLMQGDYWPEGKLAIVSALPQYCPNLAELSISYYPEEQLYEFSQAIRGLNHLEELWTDFVPDLSAIQHLANLPSFKSLHVLFVDRDHTRPATKPVVFMDTLEAMHISTSPNLMGTRAFMSGLVTPVKTLDIALPGLECSLEEVDLLVSLFPSHLSKLRLETLLVQSEGFMEPPLTYETPMTTLRPVLQFRNLRVLVWAISQMPTMTDDDMEMLGESLPRLEVLRLGDGRKANVPPRVTLDGVARLLRHCPALFELALSVDASNVPATIPAFVSDGGGIQNTNVVTLSVGDSPIVNPWPVAHYLWTILPSIEEVKASPSDWREDGWKEIWGRVPGCMDWIGDNWETVKTTGLPAFDHISG
ncbi:hypothetical protein CONPUDRAFT_165716 [Coniophora puteana RWD-64-598 SS2]|uniref:F-box domain-containing protein n=1 Tax=Coniophora puteana (strain RWD-64-598) TaxID=741705 RepID=A0A5M3MRD2_CONPW|nr:uncharacterized protein CONPUDRAFT_165716 [Coniophora puteana RWD-64-598 SS2]EIW81627.1 hypothetical protein CONPUDRAFT_165716 [Coniophora puteana RWD-64-598 SS2]